MSSTGADPGHDHPTLDHDATAARIAGELNMLHGELIQLLERVIADHAWAGYRSPAHWATVHLGVSPAQAHRLTDTATHSPNFPAIIGELTTGNISLDQAHLVVTRAPTWADRKLVNITTSATVQQLQRVIRDEYFNEPTTDTADPDGTDGGDNDPGEPGTELAARPACTRNRMTFGWDGSRFRGSFDLSADIGELVEAAFNDTRDRLLHSGTPNINNAELFAEILRAALTHTATDRLDRSRLLVHVNTDRPNHPARFSNGTPLPNSIRDYLTCDANVTPIWERDSTPIGVGRSQRTIPTRLRRMIEYRDQGCRVPGCTNQHVDIHHIEHWANGGATDPDNLISLCRFHHRQHHHHQLGVTGNPTAPDGIEFTTAQGAPYTAHPRPTPPPRPTPRSPSYRHPTGERFQHRWFSGWNHPDLTPRTRPPTNSTG